MKFKRLDPATKIPTKAHPDDLGLDLYALEDVMISSHDQELIRTGIAAAFDAGVGGIIKDRSSVAFKQRLYVKAGVIDPSYRGEIKVLLHNPNSVPKYIYAGDKIAQMVLVSLVTTDLEVVDEFDDETERGAKGFGSSN